MTDSRPAWDTVWMRMALVMCERSKCVRASVGCIIVSTDQRIVATGYNGPPAGFSAEGPCSNWCPRAQNGGSGDKEYEDCHSTHAETNAIIRADAHALQGSTAYVTSSMCKGCAKVVANSGVARVVHLVNDATPWYRTPEDTEDFLRLCGLTVDRYKDNNATE